MIPQEIRKIITHKVYVGKDIYHEGLNIEWLCNFLSTLTK